MCHTDADCADADICTDDACVDAGTCSASCSNIFDETNDPSCVQDCIPTRPHEKKYCSDGIDNDCDGLIDDDDPDC